MAEQFPRVDAIFLEALELADGAARASYLDNACGGDHDLRARVDRLLKTVPLMGAFMAKPALSPAPEGDQVTEDLASSHKISVGQSIGPYKLLQKLGEGGMGVVYMAEQEQPVRRRVALKVIRTGMDTSQVVARFEQERQALALMEHPNIARVLDAGATDDGRPYFAMELVKGIDITRYCDQERLSINDRIDLFIPVCQAIQHAHQKGIIHRDLKPSNVIVALYDGKPIPKVIDFGVAKATGQRLIERTMFTELGQIVGTLEYMAPEQAEMNNLDIDTRADIYSLGVLLYELLTGSPPFTAAELRAAGLGEMLRIIREVEPTKPSTKITKAEDLPNVAANRRLEPQRLARAVSGELDWITMKCLEKDRARRYETTSGLALDLERFLKGEPVQACPPTTGYRLRKFVHKHRAVLSAVAILALFLIAATAVSTWQAVRASRASAEAKKRQNEADDINQFMYDALTSVMPDKKGADLRVVDVLHDASIAASQRFAENAEQEAKVRIMLGDIYRELSMIKQAPPEYARSVELLKSVLEPVDRRLIEAEVRYVTSLLNLGSYRPAAPIIEELLPRVRSALKPDDELLFDIERAHAGLLIFQGQYHQATHELRQLRKRADAFNLNDRIHIALLDTLLRALDATQVEDPSVLEEMERVANDLVERSERSLGTDAVQTLRSRTLAADIMVRRGKLQQAADICTQVLETSEERLGRNHSVRIKAIDVLVDAKHRLGDSATAADLVLQKLEGSRDYDNAIIRVSRISGALPILDRGGRWIEGETLGRESSTELTKMGGGHGSMQFNADLQVARFVSRQGRTDEANSLFQSLAARLTEVSDDASVTARFHLFKGSHLRAHLDFEGAEKELQTAADTLPDGQNGTSDVNPDDLALEFVALYDAWRKPEKAAEYRDLLAQIRAALAR